MLVYQRVIHTQNTWQDPKPQFSAYLFLPYQDFVCLGRIQGVGLAYHLLSSTLW